MNAVQKVVDQATQKEQVSIGTGATICVLQDKYPATVFRAFKHGQSDIMEIRLDKAILIGDENLYHHEYDYKIDVSGNKMLFKRLPNDFNWYHVAFNERTNQYNKIADRIHIELGKKEKYEFTEIH